MTDERACEVCGSRAQVHLYDVDGFPIVRCESCRLVFVGREPTPDELIALYDEAYYEDPGAPGYAGYGDAEQRKRHHSRTLVADLERFVAPGDLLEVGCAYGYFLDEARRGGWRVRGVEPAHHAAEFARTHFGLDVWSGPLHDVQIDRGSLDAAVLWDVIEHLPNPRETVSLLSDWLRPGGVIGLSTGDIGSMAARIHGADWSLMAPPWHQFYFSRPTLRRLLDDTGFELAALTGDGVVAVDPASRHPRITGVAGRTLQHPLVARVARRLGRGSIMFAFGRKRRG